MNTTDIRKQVSDAEGDEDFAQADRIARRHIFAALDTVDALQQENVRLNGVKALLQLRTGDAEAEVTRLRSALERYGSHAPDCTTATGEEGHFDNSKPCDCGLAQARGTP